MNVHVILWTLYSEGGANKHWITKYFIFVDTFLWTCFLKLSSSCMHIMDFLTFLATSQNHTAFCMFSDFEFSIVAKHDSFTRHNLETFVITLPTIKLILWFKKKWFSVLVVGFLFSQIIDNVELSLMKELHEVHLI